MSWVSGSVGARFDQNPFKIPESERPPSPDFQDPPDFQETREAGLEDRTTEQVTPSTVLFFPRIHPPSPVPIEREVPRWDAGDITGFVSLGVLLLVLICLAVC